MKRFIAAAAVIALLALVSLFIGVSNVSWDSLFSPSPDERALQVLVISRIPRLLAVMLVGTSLGVAGLLMQMLARNRFVEPATAGSAESASLGVLAATALAPQLPVLGKMLVAACFALAGTALFLLILRRIPMRSVLIVPLVGLVLGSVFDSVTTFFAYRFDLLQSVNAWKTGDFSTVLRGRYELLWVTLVLTLCAYVAADRFTVVGMGESFTTNLGLRYSRIVALGLVIVSLVTAMVVVTVGMIPFLGLLVPNVVSLFMGDNARKSIPWVAVGGAGFVLLCDIIGRVVRFPYEIPGATIAGVIGSGLFLFLLLRRDARVG
ncbi:iron chelate uptake ABC transporter family permease subunit [Myxococcus sp. CA051A]|uniref:Iron chelate uptake ABC transporter family permease subunit n=1 Tax=Myxococcus llanfairpwllgwyngyllgogerychwyrndrobwllllantysiliogogogochensis TaxID=2590453 RepID=A0A540WV39_9BACT|nr:iron chelate uptake ABC transporter family permease subunit [Myxococcus llanfairpwllgwyngyllgogerychwyrndrobwllllantysiliogogogochensis]NTX00526.1 iron chelate uptake ABC transporter family permease subunit [Myxococcus sp. CA040A]NTX59103.1 iron chelate uptake ABC transporter family permease subunit [Myxococcus sp. CA051A]TQF12881.1 iron chelate uptake ABC transporter family permease subunit [Myxococcus llanfairpwllgwyngyllgogerychwyrndrobwllllantysiliogogogochensis]